MTFKRCFKCGETKPLTEFYAHKAMADGHLGKCKSCTKVDAHVRRHVTNRDYVLQYERARSQTSERRANAQRHSEKWKTDHPDWRKAHTIVGHAVSSGALLRWPVCSMPDCCNEKVVAHHPDYDRPLDVVWLCQSHHKQAHAIVRAGS